MQWTMSSYSLDLISLSFLGLCSDTIWAAVSLTYLRTPNRTQIINIVLATYISQSSSWISWSAVKGYWATLHASTIRMALLRFLRLRSAILAASGWGSTQPSFLATAVTMVDTSSRLGAATRTARHRDLRHWS